MENKDMFEKKWGQMDAPEGEMKAIRRSIQKRSLKTIVISVTLAVAVMAISVFGIIPAVEKLYWNPDEFTYGQRSDLETTLYAYTELFNPTFTASRVSYRHFGFASYDLEISLFTNNEQNRQTVSGTLTRGQLELDKAFFDYDTGYYGFSRSRLPSYNTPEYDERIYNEQNEHIRQQLEELPDYFLVEAKVSFSRDISMEELFALHEKYYLMKVNWIAIRHTAPTTEWTPLCGMSPYASGPVFDGIYRDYLYFNRSDIREPAQAEQHFKSLLQYSADQLQAGRGIIPHGDAAFYNNVLDYVEENGVKSYGVLITASPELLLALLDDEVVDMMSFVDIWIDLR